MRRAAKFTKRDGTGDVQEERARLTKAQADERELMVAKLRGELIDAEDVQRIWSEYIGNCRAKLLSLPTKAAHHVLSVDNYAENRTNAKDLVYEALEEMIEVWNIRIHCCKFCSKRIRFGSHKNLSISEWAGLIIAS